MEAERRHQLKTNELAEALTKVRAFWNDPQTVYWLAGIALVLAIWVGYKVWNNIQARQQAGGWAQLSEVGEQLAANAPGALNTLRDLVKDAPSAAVEGNARLQLGRVLRVDALKVTPVDENMLRESVQVLQPMIDRADMPPTLAAAAAFSLATTQESLRQFDEAQRTYEKLMNDPRLAGSPFVERAKERLASLDELRKPIAMAEGLPPPPPTAAPMAPALTPMPAGPPAGVFNPGSPAEPAAPESAPPTPAPATPEQPGTTTPPPAEPTDDEAEPPADSGAAPAP